MAKEKLRTRPRQTETPPRQNEDRGLDTLRRQVCLLWLFRLDNQNLREEFSSDRPHQWKRKSACQISWGKGLQILSVVKKALAYRISGLMCWLQCFNEARRRKMRVAQTCHLVSQPITRFLRLLILGASRTVIQVRSKHSG